MANVTSLDLQELKDTAIRVPWWYMEYRPRLIATKDPRRKSFGGRKR